MNQSATKRETLFCERHYQRILSIFALFSLFLTIRKFHVRAEPCSQFRRSLTLSFAFGPTIDFLIRVPSLILPIRVLFRSLLAFMERKIFGFNMNLSLVFPLGF